VWTGNSLNLTRRAARAGTNEGGKAAAIQSNPFPQGPVTGTSGRSRGRVKRNCTEMQNKE